MNIIVSIVLSVAVTLAIPALFVGLLWVTEYLENMEQGRREIDHAARDRSDRS